MQEAFYQRDINCTLFRTVFQRRRSFFSFISLLSCCSEKKNLPHKVHSKAKKPFGMKKRLASGFDVKYSNIRLKHSELKEKKFNFNLHGNSCDRIFYAVITFSQASCMFFRTHEYISKVFKCSQYSDWHALGCKNERKKETEIISNQRKQNVY